MATQTAHRGDVWIVDMGMVGKTRPALILGISYLPHERMLITIVPSTTQVMGTRFEIASKAHFLRVQGVFDAQQIYTVHQVKLLKRIGKLPADEFALVETAVREWLNLK